MIVLFFALGTAAADAQRTTGGAQVVTPHFNTDSFTAQRPLMEVMGATPVPVVYVADTVKNPRPLLMGKPARPQHEIKGRVAAPKPAHKPKKVPAVTQPPAYRQGEAQIVTPPTPTKKKKT